MEATKRKRKKKVNVYWGAISGPKLKWGKKGIINNNNNDPQSSAKPNHNLKIVSHNSKHFHLV